MKRALTVRFERSVSGDGTPDTLEIVLTPLISSVATTDDSVLVGGRQSRKIVLDTMATVRFDVIPSYSTELSDPVHYRLSWRNKYMGKITSQDFIMPNQDVRFEDLGNLGSLISSESYLWTSDLGKPGRVAQLDEDGDLLDGSGNKILDASEAVGELSDSILGEVASRKSEDIRIKNLSRNYTDQKTSDVHDEMTLELTSSLEGVESLIRQEASARISGDQASNSASQARTNDILSRLTGKADLIEGKVPASQLPSLTVMDIHVVRDMQEMLALDPNNVNRGDLGILPDSVWVFLGGNTSSISSWLKFSVPVSVSSVNGLRGDIVLTPDRIGAVAKGSIRISDVHSLSDSLESKGSKSELSGAIDRLNSVESRLNLLSYNNPGSGGDALSPLTVGFSSPDWRLSNVRVLSPFGIRADGFKYFNPEGAPPGEAAFPFITENGSLVLRKYNPNADPEPESVSREEFFELEYEVRTIPRKPENGWGDTDLSSLVRQKLNRADTAHSRLSSATHLSSPNTLVQRSETGAFEAFNPTKPFDVVNKSYLESQLTGFISRTEYSVFDSVVRDQAQKLRDHPLFTAEGFISAEYLRNIPVSAVAGLKGALDSKPTMTNGVVPHSLVESEIPQAKIADLAEALEAKADLVDGKIPTAQIPSVATSEFVTVQTKSDIFALTSDQVQAGDIAIVSEGPDQGLYIFSGGAISAESSWIRLESSGGVESVNGQAGIVNLSAADVGARPVSAPVPFADVSGLKAAFDLKADRTLVDAGLSNRPTFDEINLELSKNNSILTAVDFVAAGSVVPSGSKMIDGVTVPGNTRVLLTGQGNASENGIWETRSGSWIRPSDSPVGDYLHPGTVVIVRKGTNHANSMWQTTIDSPVVIGTGTQAWIKALQAGEQIRYAAGNGMELNDTTFSVKSGEGLVTTSAGVSLDPQKVMRKYAANVPGGNTQVTITHNLNSRDVSVSVREVASGDLVLVGVTASTVNSVVLDFAQAPQANQFRVVVFG